VIFTGVDADRIGNRSTWSSRYAIFRFRAQLALARPAPARCHRLAASRQR